MSHDLAAMTRAALWGAVLGAGRLPEAAAGADAGCVPSIGASCASGARPGPAPTPPGRIDWSETAAWAGGGIGIGGGARGVGSSPRRRAEGARQDRPR